ncbi:pyridoxamine 5'-phosphate oxidase family protein [Amycolatopsis sp. NBC_01488]|uniref:pyridoxamine 5'-phosphate oxidase family protein n=1 Tax=Amycolatopsis sp. NBC_01488 TaxID=2903563 RepID=UPI002E2DA626|nr:pyridoxamine 5'-phosphate oxidase family protein [Amycolatopsis sp. NBC_01488]
MALSVEDREQFLAEPHVGALSVTESPDRAPLTIPLWYQYTPGGELWLRTLPRSRKMKAIDAAGRFSLLAHRTTPTVRYVSVEGPVVRTEPDSPSRARELAARYLAPEKVDAYLEFERTQIGEHVVVYLRPERWLSLDMGES